MRYDDARSFFAFIAFPIAWAAAGSLVLGTGAINPFVFGIGWLVSVVWGVGCILEGPRLANYAVAVSFGPLAGFGAFFWLVGFIFL